LRVAGDEGFEGGMGLEIFLNMGDLISSNIFRAVAPILPPLKIAAWSLGRFSDGRE